MTPYDRLIQRLLPALEFHQNRYARELEETLKPGCRWLDLGAGTVIHGGWLNASQQAMRERARQLVGVDLVQPHLRRNPYLTAAAVADGMRLPFADGSFDIVTANMVVEHLADPSAVFSEVARVLAPGGRFVFVTPNVNHPVVRALSIAVSPRWRRLLAHRAERRALEHIFHTFYRANSVAAVRTAARAAGLEPERVDVFCSYPMVRFALSLTWLECQWIRLCHLRPFRGLGSNLVACLGKPVGQLVVEMPPIVEPERVSGEVAAAAG